MILKSLRGELEWVLPDLTEGEWEDVLEQGLADEERADIFSVRKAVEYIQRQRRRYRGESTSPSPSAPEMIDPDAPASVEARVRALSRIVVQMANQDTPVLHFRADELDNQLLAYDEVEAWITKQLSQQQAGPREGLLAFGVPDDPWRRLVATTKGSVLDRLRTVSAGVSQTYGWDEAQATVFVLTGLVPLIPPLRATQQLNLTVPALSRITLTIDPALPPQSVAEYYSEVRGQMIDGRYRPQSEKHLELAVFTAQRPHHEKWRKTLVRWNHEHPEWRYDHEANFRRDCRRALTRLLNPLNMGATFRDLLGERVKEDDRGDHPQ